MNDESDICSGSAWAALDETFFALVQDVFSHQFLEGAGVLLAANDDAAPDQETPTAITLPEQSGEVTILAPADLEREAAARRASMRRHPTTRRRF